MNVLLWLPVAAYMAAIFYVSAQSSLPGRGGVPDVVLHGGEYFGLAMLTFRAVADLGIGLPYFVAQMLGYGAGRVVAVTYEYGNAFGIVAGLLNMLVVLDAWDVAEGRK